MTVAAQYGVYTHSRADGRCFYIGKGTERRSRRFGGRNPHHTNILRKEGADKTIVKWVECESEEQSFELERQLIAVAREIGLPLVNQTAGGEGMLNPSVETRAKMSAAKIGKVYSAETRAKMSASHIGVPKAPWSVEHRAKQDASKRGRGMAVAETLDARKQQRRLTTMNWRSKNKERIREYMQVYHLARKEAKND